MHQDGRLRVLGQMICDAFIAMGNAIQTVLTRLSFDDVVARLQTSFTTISTVLNKLLSTFTFISKKINFFFNSFAVTEKSFVPAFLYSIGENINGWGKLAEVVDNDIIARQMQEATNYLRSLGYEFARQTAEDANTVKDSFVGIYEVLDDKHEQPQQAGRRESKLPFDEIQNDQEQQQQAIEQTDKTGEQAATKIKATFSHAADAIFSFHSIENLAINLDPLCKRDHSGSVSYSSPVGALRKQDYSGSTTFGAPFVALRKRDHSGRASFGAPFGAPFGALSMRDFCEAPFGTPFPALCMRDFCEAPFGAPFGALSMRDFCEAPFGALSMRDFCEAPFGACFCAQLVKIYHQQFPLSLLDCHL